MFNVRAVPLDSLARELASSQMEAKKLSPLRARQAEAIVGVIFARLVNKQGGYLSELSPSLSLVRGIQSSIDSLRLSGARVEELKAGDFETPEKARDMCFLLREYEQELAKRSLIDSAGIFSMAIESVHKQGAISETGTFYIPADIELRGLAKALWQALPEDKRQELPVDQPGKAAAENDSGLLGLISSPQDAPRAKQDGSVSMFKAVGEVNEVREILRRCLADKTPLDDVELVYTDEDCYVPLIYETIWHLYPDEEEPPVTFARGLPSWYFRPARALLAWLAWRRDGFPQSKLATMIAEGLLRLKGVVESDYERLAKRFRSVRIGRGRDNYLETLELEITALKRSIAKSRDDEKKDERTYLAHRLNDLQIVNGYLRELIGNLPKAGASPAEILNGAHIFLSKLTRHSGRMDEYVAKQLCDEINEMRDCLGAANQALDVAAWLEELAASERISGAGPRAGKLYVTNLELGGHSGRGSLFVLGLDDGRFPGAGLQDPFLLDRERRDLCGELPLASERLRKRTKDLARLFVRQRGMVTISFSCRELSENRELQPAPVIFSAYRILANEHQGDLAGMKAWLGESVCFTPARAGLALDGREWWYRRLLGEDRPLKPLAAVLAHYPGLQAGEVARLARSSEELTEYDGYVPQAGKDLDPFSEGGITVSANRLEQMGQIPMDFFFRYGLRISPPDEYEPDPRVWLDHLQKGSLLHSVFKRFMRRLVEKKERAGFVKHQGLLNEILSREIERYRGAVPPPSEEVFLYERRELARITKVFLYSEEARAAEYEPKYFEVAVGREADGEGTPLDQPTPLELELRNGKKIRTIGQIDRVDLLSDGSYRVWDYKTGKLRDDESELYCQGRRLQCALYPLIIGKLLERHEGRRVTVSAGYLHPADGDGGNQVAWTAEQLTGAKDIIARLCELIAAGCFIFTENPKAAVSYSDYLACYTNAEELSAGVLAKVANKRNTALEMFRELRGLAGEENDGKEE